MSSVENTGSGGVEATNVRSRTFAETWPDLAEYENLSVMEIINQMAKRIKELEQRVHDLEYKGAPLYYERRGDE